MYDDAAATVAASDSTDEASGGDSYCPAVLILANDTVLNADEEEGVAGLVVVWELEERAAAMTVCEDDVQELSSPKAWSLTLLLLLLLFWVLLLLLLLVVGVLLSPPVG